MTFKVLYFSLTHSKERVLRVTQTCIIPMSCSQSDCHYVFCGQFVEETRKARGEREHQSFALNGSQVLSWQTPLRMHTANPLLYLSLFLSFFLWKEGDSSRRTQTTLRVDQHQYCQFNNFTVSANLEPVLRDKNDITIQHKNLLYKTM